MQIQLSDKDTFSISNRQFRYQKMEKQEAATLLKQKSLEDNTSTLPFKLVKEKRESLGIALAVRTPLLWPWR